MNWLITLVVNAVAVLVAAFLLPGVVVDGFLSALLAAIVLAVVNTLIRPILLFLTLPINILTLGLFTFVINAIVILIVAAVVPGFRVDGFWWALLFSLVLSVVSYLLFTFLPIGNSAAS